jgi:hypothetical protein
MWVTGVQTCALPISYGLCRASVPVQYSYTSTPPVGHTACTEPQCLYSTAIPLLPLWVARPVQSLSACTRVHFTFNHFNPSYHSSGVSWFMTRCSKQLQIIVLLQTAETSHLRRHKSGTRLTQHHLKFFQNITIAFSSPNLTLAVRTVRFLSTWRTRSWKPGVIQDFLIRINASWGR